MVETYPCNRFSHRRCELPVYTFVATNNKIHCCDTCPDNLFRPPDWHNAEHHRIGIWPVSRVHFHRKPSHQNYISICYRGRPIHRCHPCNAQLYRIQTIEPSKTHRCIGSDSSIRATGNRPHPNCPYNAVLHRIFGLG